MSNEDGHDSKMHDTETEQRRRLIPLDDRTLGILGVVVGIAIVGLTSSQVTASSVLVVGSDSPFLQGGFFPRVVGGLIAFCGAVLAISEWMRVRRGELAPWPMASLSVRVMAASWIFLGAIWLATVVTVTVGFRIAMILLVTPLSRWFGAPSWLHALGVAVILAVVVHLLFSGPFNVPLPSSWF